MKKRAPLQLSLPEPKMSAAQRRAWIRDRLAGYGYRQAARVSRRKEGEKRRAAAKINPPAENVVPDPSPQQLSIPRELYRRVN